MNYITTAPDRKTLVKAIAEHFELDPNYNGVSAYGHFGKAHLPWEQ